jgi:quercetin dioxygenase-like cupin family protein
MEKSMKLVWLAAVFFALAIAPLQAQERKEVTVTELLSTTVTSSGQPIVLPQKDAQIVVLIYDVAPGATLPVHKHPYPRYGYVLSEELRVTDMETGRDDTYKPGDFIPESVEQWHMGANIGDNPLKLLIIDIVEKGQTNTVVESDRFWAFMAWHLPTKTGADPRLNAPALRNTRQRNSRQ